MRRARRFWRVTAGFRERQFKPPRRDAERKEERTCRSPIFALTKRASASLARPSSNAENQPLEVLDAGSNKKLSASQRLLLPLLSGSNSKTPMLIFSRADLAGALQMPEGRSHWRQGGCDEHQKRLRKEQPSTEGSGKLLRTNRRDHFQNEELQPDSLL